MRQEQPADLRTELARRRLLRGLGGLSIALTLPIWKSATVFGQDQNAPAARRFVTMFSANGTVASDFFQGGTSGAPLRFGRILAPLQQFQSDILVLKGVHMNSTIENELGVSGALKPGGPHMKGPGAMLTGGSLLEGNFSGSGGPAGYADRISLDQYVAERIGGSTKFPSLEFGVRITGQEPLRVISYRGANQPNTAVDDPWKVHARIFEGAGLSDAELEQLIADNQSVLDFLKDDIGALQTRMNSEDKARLEAHLDGIRRIEQRLANTVSCDPIEMPEKFNPREMGRFPEVGQLQMDLMLLALTCGMTNVATFMWGNADSWQYYPWIGINEEHHELSHAGDEDTETRDKLIEINAWHSEQVAYVLGRLKQLQDIDGTSMLDNTVFLWGNELGAGNTHTYKDIPWLLAGGRAGGLNPGRYLSYPDLPHNNLLVSICHALGFSDVTTFGIPGVCTGPLPDLTG